MNNTNYKIITTEYANFKLISYNQYILPENERICPHVFDTVNEIDCMRIIRLLIFCGYKEICIHTKTHENWEGWAYALHKLYNDTTYRINLYNDKIKL